MNILIAGNMGYVGSGVVSHLRAMLPGARLIGCDTGYFAHCLTGVNRLPESGLDVQFFADVRELPDGVLQGIDAVVLLAAVSNDPMGARFETVTYEINHRACCDLAARALRAGASRIVFASSCSIYGFAECGARSENDALNPLTAYSRSKVAAEQVLSALDPGDAVITSLRFATACGMSARLRLDLVLNDFVACALATREITVLSDGSPWRPLIEVRDMARAIEWALLRDPAEAGRYVAVNVGAARWNYQVKDLAEAVAASVPGTRVSINRDAPPDRRSYKVDFSLFEKIAPRHQPQIELEQAIGDLLSGLERAGFKDPAFRDSNYMRLKVLEAHMASNRLDERLHWRHGSSASTANREAA